MRIRIYEIIIMALPLLGLVIPAQSSADIITVSVNFDVAKTTTSAVPADELNGVVSVNNWNNWVIGRNPLTPVTESPFSDIFDSDANIIPGLSSSWTGSPGSESWNTAGSNGGGIYGDFVINADNGTLIIAGIPSNNGVRLLTYHNAFNDDTTTNFGKVTANGISQTYDDHLWDNSDHNANPFLYTDFENYLDFSLPSTSSINVDFEAGADGFQTVGINAFQLVYTEISYIPLPSTPVLAALGLMSLGINRSRQRR